MPKNTVASFFLGHGVYYICTFYFFLCFVSVARNFLGTESAPVPAFISSIIKYH